MRLKGGLRRGCEKSGEGLARGRGTMRVRADPCFVLCILHCFICVFLFLFLLLCPVFTDNAEERQHSLTQPEYLLGLHVHVAL